MDFHKMSGNDTRNPFCHYQALQFLKWGEWNDWSYRNRKSEYEDRSRIT